MPPLSAVLPVSASAPTEHQAAVTSGRQRSARQPAPAPSTEARELTDARRARYRIEGPTTRLLALREPTPTRWEKVAATVFQGTLSPVPIAVQPPALPEALNAADAVHAYASATRENYKCSSVLQRGRDVGAQQLQQLGLALGDTAPLLRCTNHPVRYIARVDKVVDRSCNLTDSAGGHWFFNQELVTLADSGGALREVTVHEIIHGALQSHDPRTCTNHPDGFSPLVREWQAAMGWSADGKTLTSKTPGESPPTEHAAKTLWEDIAESFSMALVAPEKLRAKSRTRLEFAERVLRELREKGVAVTPPATS